MAKVIANLFLLLLCGWFLCSYHHIYQRAKRIGTNMLKNYIVCGTITIGVTAVCMTLICFMPSFN